MDTTYGPDLPPLAAVRDAADAHGAGEAARLLAAAGVPVFPCVQGSTRPLTTCVLGAPSADVDRVAWWWSRYPSTNLAIPTGRASGLDVVEIDPGPDTRSGFRTIRKAMGAGVMPEPGLMIATPSGGLQLFFSHSLDADQRSWTAPGSGVGFRGDGGYVLLPPSLVQQADGKVARYRLVGSGSSAAAALDAAGLRHFLDPSQHRAELATRTPSNRRATTTVRPARVAAPIPATGPAAAASDARSLSSPDTGGLDRRPPEVVSL